MGVNNPGGSSSAPAYLSQVGLLTQVASGDPVDIPLIEDIGTIVWTRLADGQYNGFLSGAFPVSKTFLMIGASNEGFDGTNITVQKMYVLDGDTVEILTGEYGVDLVTGMFFQARDGKLVQTPYEIRVYV